MSEFPPIADYAFMSDCETTCLIAPDGAVEWLGLHRPDSPSRHLGNFPQAFTHLALIDAVGRVINLESDGRRQSTL